MIKQVCYPFILLSFVFLQSSYLRDCVLELSGCVGLLASRLLCLLLKAFIVFLAFLLVIIFLLWSKLPFLVCLNLVLPQRLILSNKGFDLRLEFENITLAV